MKIQSIRTNSYVNNFSGRTVKLPPAHVYSVVKKPSAQGDAYEKALEELENQFMNLAVKTGRISVDDIAAFIAKPISDSHLGFLLVNKKVPANTHGVDFAEYFDRISADKKTTVRLSFPIEEQMGMIHDRLAS